MFLDDITNLMSGVRIVPIFQIIGKVTLVTFLG